MKIRLTSFSAESLMCDGFNFSAGKDTIIFATEEYLSTPSTAKLLDDDPDEMDKSNMGKLSNKASTHASTQILLLFYVVFT